MAEARKIKDCIYSGIFYYIEDKDSNRFIARERPVATLPLDQTSSSVYSAEAAQHTELKYQHLFC